MSSSLITEVFPKPLFVNPANSNLYSEKPYWTGQQPSAMLMPIEPCFDCGLIECVCVDDLEERFHREPDFAGCGL